MLPDTAAVHLRSGGVSLLLAPDEVGRPAVVHWGAELSDRDAAGLLATGVPAVLNSSLDEPRSFPVLAARSDGWSGTPTLACTADGLAVDLRPVGTEAAADGRSVTLRYRDPAGSVDVAITLHLDGSGIVHAGAEVTAPAATGALDLGAVRLLLPLPQRAAEILDFTGRWSAERRPQRHPVADGTWTRSSRRGRPGHDSAYLTVVGTLGFGFRTGEAWACHVAWSGNQEQLVERLPEGAGTHGAVLGGGELLDLGEVRLGPGEIYRSPTVWFAWSDQGLDGVTDRFHRSVRRLGSAPRRPRPLVLNTWEAVYFDHGHARLAELAEVAARVGVERFVLDDGWFLGRRDDTRGLGDWSVDPAVWPAGLGPLAATVHGLGMELGLWFEPEMVNPDSDLARAHPDWLLGSPAVPGWRHQHVLDLAHPDAFAHVLGRLDALVGEIGVDFIKWDHNRDLHATAGAAPGRAGAHAHTRALYRLLDELRRRHPDLEIESCASGGARPDLGIMSRVQRLWASDTNDPVERQHIQRWTQTVLPPELIGSHVGPGEAHTTHRVTSLPFRLTTALFGHAGLEWDLTRCTDQELAAVTAWAGLYRELRPLLHTGRTVRADDVDPGALLHGVVAQDGTHALFAWLRLETSGSARTPRVPLPGLDPDREYRVRVRTELGEPHRHQITDPAWLRADDAPVLTGRALALAGLPLPLLNPGSALLLELTAVRPAA